MRSNPTPHGMRGVATRFAFVVLGMGTVAVAGCGGDAQPPPPNLDGSVDSGFRDAGTFDGATDDNGMPPDDGGADADVTVDGGGLDASPDDGGPGDAGPEDGGPQVGESPVIANIAWTVAQDGSCGPGSGVLFSVVVSDPDTIAFFLEANVTGMGSCFLSDVDSATDMVDITLTNCPHDQNYTPTVTLTDPEGNSATVSGFTVMPCSNGAYFP